MSLTSFLKIKDVREAFKQEFKKPRLKLNAELLAPPLTDHYSRVGTAFDYLLRFYIKRLNPDAIEREWISEEVLSFLRKLNKDKSVVVLEEPLCDPDVYRKVEEIIHFARKAYNDYLKNGEITSDLLRAVLLLAQVDVIYRAGIVDENLGSIDEKDIEDVRNLISLVKPEYFKARKVCILNPTFGIASGLVGGADADLVIDDAIIDIKTTKKANLERDFFNQLIGYYILYKIGGIDGMPSNHEIKRLGIYFSRYGCLVFVKVQDVIKKDSFESFVEWFKERANEVFHLSKQPQQHKGDKKMQKHKQVVVVVKPKSRFIAVLLAMLFGPFGLFYSTVRGGIIMSIAMLLIYLFSETPELMMLLVNIFVCAPWASMATTQYNKKLLSESSY